jgi:hypothetical protein
MEFQFDTMPASQETTGVGFAMTDQEHPADKYAVTWNGIDAAGSVYFRQDGLENAETI